MADVTDLYYPATSNIGYGSQLLVGQGDGSPETFVAVPNVKSISVGDFSGGVVDVTHLRSPGRHREKRATIRDSGPITLVCSYDRNHGAFKNNPGSGDGFTVGHTMLGLSRSMAENNYQLFEPDTPLPDGGSPAETGLTTPFRGQVTRFSIGPLTIDNVREVTIEITPLSDYSGSWA